MPCVEPVEAVTEDRVEDEFAGGEEAAEAGVAGPGEAALDFCIELLFCGGFFGGVGAATAAGGEGGGGAFAGIVTELDGEGGVTWGTIVLEELVELMRATAWSDMHREDQVHVTALCYVNNGM